MTPGGSASPRQRTAWRCSVGAHLRWSGGSYVVVWGGVVDDGRVAAARSVPLGTAKIHVQPNVWIVRVQGSAASTRWLGEVLWVSPSRMPTLSREVIRQTVYIIQVADLATATSCMRLVTSELKDDMYRVA